MEREEVRAQIVRRNKRLTAALLVVVVLALAICALYPDAAPLGKLVITGCLGFLPGLWTRSGRRPPEDDG